MKLCKITSNLSFGLDFGYSGTYWYLCVWCRKRFTAKEYGPGELRIYRKKWWKNYYEKDKKGKLKLVWEGRIFEHVGGW